MSHGLPFVSTERHISVESKRSLQQLPPMPLWVFNPFIRWWTTSKTQQRPAVLWSVFSARVKEFLKVGGKKNRNASGIQSSVYIWQHLTRILLPPLRLWPEICWTGLRGVQNQRFCFKIFAFLDGIQQQLFLLEKTPQKQRNVSVDYRLP